MKTRVHVDIIRRKAWLLRAALKKRRLDELVADARRLVAQRNRTVEFLARFLGRWVLRYRITLKDIEARWAKSGHFKSAQNWYWPEQDVADNVLRLAAATDEGNGDSFIEIDEREAKTLGYNP